MHIILVVLFLIFSGCTSLEVIPEPSLDLLSVKSRTFCLTWNWHPFCLENKPNSFNFKGTVNNTSSEKKIYIDYYLDSFDTELPIGISIKIDGTYYLLKKILTDYTDSMKIRSELSEEVTKLFITAKNPITLSYSNRRTSYNFTLSEGESASVQKELSSVIEKINSIQKMKIVK